MPQRVAIEAWNPDFGAALRSPELELSDAHVDGAVELARKPLAPSSVPASTRAPMGSSGSQVTTVWSYVSLITTSGAGPRRA